MKEGFYICDSFVKEQMLRQRTDSFSTMIFLTMDELREKLFFKVHPKAVIFLAEKYRISYALAEEYLRYLPYIEPKEYHQPKLDGMVSMYQTLLKEGLIVRDLLFGLRLKQFPVMFVNPEDSAEYRKIKMAVSHQTDAEEIFWPTANHTPEVFEFETMEEEVFYIFSQIQKLLNQNVSPNHIFLLGMNDSYLYLCRRFAKSFRIPVEFPPMINISSTQIVQDFLKMCRQDLPFSEILSHLDSQNELYDAIVGMLNRYELKDSSSRRMYSFLKYRFGKMAFPQVRYAEKISVVSDDAWLRDEDYAFYMGFNSGMVPKPFAEQGLLFDEDRKKLGISTSEERAILAKIQTKQRITSIPHMVLTYKKMSQKERFLPSFLIDELHLTVQKPEIPFGFSKREDDLRLAKEYDFFVKYGQLQPNLKRYGMNQVDYQTFHHQYQPLSKECLQRHFSDKKLKMAYSNVKLYFSCPFGYYADRILGLNEFKPQMAARMGSFAHAVLEDSYEDTFDFTASVTVHRKEFSQNEKDDFFFDQMKDVVSSLIEFNRTHEQKSRLTSIQRELHIVVEEDQSLFEGYIDKLMYAELDGEIYAAIVDYKTGKDIISLDNVEDGFHLQLPAYMYLLTNYSLFQGKKIHIVGIYLQKVNIIALDAKKSVREQIEKSFLLQGYSIADPQVLKLLDPTFENSDYIQSMGTTKNNTFRSYAKVLDERDQEQLISLVITLLERAKTGILGGEFPIAPKMIGGKNESCTFCQYKDLCFYDYQDVLELDRKPFKEGRKKDGLDE